MLRNYNAPAHVILVNSPDAPDITERYEVKKFPTFKWFLNGEVSDYKGAIDFRMYNWILRTVYPGIRHLECKDLK